MTEIVYKELSYRIIGIAMEVHKILGGGFLEKVYENSMMILFEENNLNAKNQVKIDVFFKNKVVGDYVADILVDDKIILEILEKNGGEMSLAEVKTQSQFSGKKWDKTSKNLTKFNLVKVEKIEDSLVMKLI